MKLPTAIVELLLAHKEQSRFQALDDFIFCREDGSPLGQNNVRCRLYRAMDAAGIKRIKGQYGFHIFRHTAGSLIYARSRDLKLVQKTLGDSDLKTTGNVYIHLEQADSERGSLIVLDEIFSNCDPSVTRKKREAG